MIDTSVVLVHLAVSAEIVECFLRYQEIRAPFRQPRTPGIIRCPASHRAGLLVFAETCGSLANWVKTIF
jgi:hypothetical protein